MTSADVEPAVVPLDEREQAHVDSFALTRPDWTVCALSKRLFDEDMDHSREHKYARVHPYVTGMAYTLKRISAMGPCRVLDIGSPLTQNIALACLPGVDVTVLDVRPSDAADVLGLKWKVGTATALPFEDASWSVVTSLWVMGHVGDGRYGDALDIDGDRKMMAELARVLEPGGTAIVGPGLMAEACGNIYNLHRIYTWAWLEREFASVGLTIVDHTELPVASDIFLGGPEGIERRDGFYGLATLTK